MRDEGRERRKDEGKGRTGGQIGKGEEGGEGMEEEVGGQKGKGKDGREEEGRKIGKGGE